VTHAGADAGNLVRRHAHAHARAADEDAARRIASLQRVAYLLGKVWIVVGQVACVGAQVHDFVAALGEKGAHFFLEREAGMVGGDD